VVLCSWGDNITPPQQALGWILDLYDDERELIANGQTIVYTLHQSIGHLGIFVSGKVATKEHGEFVSCMDMIEVLPPGLYEAVITEVTEDTENPDLVHGRYLFRLETRTLDHLRALGGNDADDERRFATAARVSEINEGLYRTLAGPMVRAAMTPPVAEALREAHPNRVRFRVFSDQNPFMQAVKPLAESVRAQRKPAGRDNPLLAMEQAASSWITSCLQAYGETRDAMTEALFLTTYGSPLLQALVGLGPHRPASPHHIERDLARETAEARLRAELERRFEVGHVEEALLRALIYIRLPEGIVDERGFAVLKMIRASRPPGKRLSVARIKEMVREQFLLVLLDEERAISAIPTLLGPDAAERRAALDVLHRVIEARGAMREEGRRRLERVEALLGVKSEKPAKAEATNV
jgi:hypothetical protein